jgi:competence protein ComEA
VYELPARPIVEDTVQTAGGPTADADLNRVNLAREPQHEEQIVIPCLPTPAPTITSTVATGTGAPAANPGTTRDGLNLDTATAGELGTLPGIGPATLEKLRPYVCVD